MGAGNGMEGEAMKIKVSKPFMTSEHAEMEVRDECGFAMMRTGIMDANDRAELRKELVNAIAELDKFPKDTP
jgi:hypothetical protein